MIQVQLQTIEIDGEDIRQVPLAQMIAYGDQVEFRGEEQLFHRDIPVFSHRLNHWISYEADPEEWGRNLGQVYRNPDFEAVVLEDSNPFELSHEEVERQHVVLGQTAFQEA